MKLWRRIPSDFQEIKDIKDISSDKPIVFIFPIATVKSNDTSTHHYASGLAKMINNALGADETKQDIETLAVTYDASTSPPKRVFMNLAMDKYKDPDALEFVQKFLFPIIERQQQTGQSRRIMFVGQCYGSQFAENIRACFIDEARTRGMSDQEINDITSNITLVTISNISRSVDPEAPRRNHNIDYTTVAFALDKDVTAMTENAQAYWRTRPTNHIPHQNTRASISQLAEGKVQVLANAPRHLFPTPQDSNAPERVDNTDRLPGIPWSHSSDFLLTEALNSTTPPIIRRVLRNGINLSVDSKPDTHSLLYTQDEPVSKNLKSEFPTAVTADRCTRLIEEGFSRGEPSHASKGTGLTKTFRALLEERKYQKSQSQER